MQVTLVKVNRYSYESKGDGVIHEGCAFDVMASSIQDDNTIGYDVKSYRTKYSNFAKLVDLFKANKPVELEVEYVQMRNGNYYAKAKKVNDIEL